MSEIFEMPKIHPGHSAMEVEFRKYVHKYINKHFSKGVKQSILMQDGYLSVVYKVLSDNNEEKVLKLSSNILDLYLEKTVLDIYRRNGFHTPDIHSIERFKAPHGQGALATMQFINSLNLSELHSKRLLKFDKKHGQKMAELLLNFQRIGNTKILGLPFRSYEDVEKKLPKPLALDLQNQLYRLQSEYVKAITGKETVIHGDFKESNVLLLNGKDYLLIDPNPKYGDALADVAYYLLRSLAYKTEPQVHLQSFVRTYLQATKRDIPDLNRIIALEAARLSYKWFEIEKTTFDRFYQLTIEAIANYQVEPKSLRWLDQKFS